MKDSTKSKNSGKPKLSKKTVPKTTDTAKPAEKAAIPPKPPNVKTKKRIQKNAPDKPRPAWLFPPDEENLALNSKPISEEQKRKDQEDWDAAVKYLEHKALTAPKKAPPPSQLLTLVSAFLKSFGFNSASLILTMEHSARKVLDGWDNESGKEPLENGLPDLVKIYKDWYKERQESKKVDQTSSEEEGSATIKKAKKASKKQKIENIKMVQKAEETSSSSSSDSSGESDSDVEMDDAIPAKGDPKTKAKVDTSSGTSSPSDSDADEKEASKIAAKAATTKKPTVNGLVNNLQRKACSSSSSSSNTSSSDSDAKIKSTNKAPASSSSSSSDTSSSDSGSDSGSDTSPADKPLPASASNSSSSTSSSDSDSDTKPVSKPSEPSKPSKPTNSGLIIDSRKSSTDTSGTLPNGTTTDAPPLKRKRSLSPYSKRLPAVKLTKKNNQESFTRVPKDTKVDEKLASNAYVPYDYAERAHQDLSVTKGKGFTKEKNKKKRGSYRGGMIDVDGRKGIKFED